MKCFDRYYLDKLKDIEESKYNEDSDNGDDMSLALLDRSKEVFGRNVKDNITEDHNRSVCNSSEINWDLLALCIIRNKTENDDYSDSENEENDQTNTEYVHVK